MKAIITVHRDERSARATASVASDRYLVPKGVSDHRLLTLELPFAYHERRFTPDLIRKACRRIDHPVDPLYELPLKALRPVALKDFLDAEFMDFHFYFQPRDKIPFDAAAVRDFIRRNARWFFARPLSVRGGKAELVDSIGRLTRLSALVNLALTVGRLELQGVAKVEESREFVDPRVIPDNELEETILRIQSDEVKASLATELLRRALVPQDAAPRFPLLAEGVRMQWQSAGPALQLYMLLYSPFGTQSEDSTDKRYLIAPQNLRGAIVDISAASVEKVGIVDVALGLRAMDIRLERQAFGAFAPALTAVHAGRKVYFQAPRALIGTVARHGGQLQYRGNTLTVRSVDIGATIQEMERVHALAFLDPGAVADRVLAAEPGIKAAADLAARAARDTKAGQQLADLAMEVLFSIDPEVAAALIRGRQRYSAA